MDTSTVIAVAAVSVPVVVALVTFGLHILGRIYALEAKVDMLVELAKKA